MTSPFVLYEDVNNKISVYEIGDSVEFVSPPSIEAPFTKHFEARKCKRSERDGRVVWTIEKSNADGITMLNHMTKQDITQKYKGSATPMTGDIHAMMAAVASVAQPVVGTYPRLIYENKQVNIQIVDYTDKSVVIFTPKEWGQQNQPALVAAHGKFGQWKSSPDGSSKSYGWMFAKSNAKARELFQTLTGEDIIAKATPTPSRGRGSGWADKPASPAKPTALPSTKVMLPMPGIPTETKVSAPATPTGDTLRSPETPVDALNMVLNLLMMPIAKATSKPVTDPSGVTVRMGFFGPEADVKAMVEAYMTEFPATAHATGIDLDVTTGGNRAVIVSRSKE